jgi:HTH-type transcriptional regulator/antitoxin HigA
MNKIEYNDIIAFHPGSYIKELLDDVPMNQAELAKRLGTTEKTVSELINGIAEMTDVMARNLSIVFGTTIDLWLNLNEKYQKKKLEIEQLRREEEERSILKMMDDSFWANMGVVAQVSNYRDQIAELQKYFRISSLKILARPDFLVQFRQSQTTEVSEKNIVNSNAWVQTAFNFGTQCEVGSYSEAKMKACIKDIRMLTHLTPDAFVPELKKKLAYCGVALVMLPYLKNSGVNGAVKWIGQDKAILAINNKNKYADVFWFSLLHECKHVLQHRSKPIIDMSDDRYFSPKLEEDADEFASNTLIPKDKYKEFTKNGEYTEQSIKDFARNINIHPGIVVGRLQKNKLIPYSKLNTLRVKYEV